MQVWYESGMNTQMARKKKFHDEALARFPAGTFDRIEQVLSPIEDRTDFFREAVERELSRRERQQRNADKRGPADEND